MTEEEKKRFQEEQEKLKKEQERVQKEKKKDQDQEKKEVKASKSEPKDGISILKEIGLKNVSNKTFINLENLTNLLNKDFEKLHKTKALGFIQILERDFKVDLSELKEDYLSYINGGRRISAKKTLSSKGAPKVSSNATKPQKIVKKENNNSNIKIGPYLLIGAALLAAYFILKGATDDAQKISMGDLNISQKSEVKEEPKGDLISSSVEKSQPTTNEDENLDDVDLNKVVKQMLSNADDTNDTKLDNTIEQESKIAVAKEVNISQQNTNETSDESKDEKNSSQITQNNDLDQKRDITLANIEKESTQNKIISQKQEAKPAKEKEIKQVAKKPQVKKGLYIIPVQKAWVGVIYLDDYTKKDFLIRGKLNLNSNRDQLILVGHNKIKIYNNGKQSKINSKKMARFIYQGGKLREISKQEYTDLSAGVRW
jgi:hypothetical protein